LRLAVCQIDIALGEVEGNLGKVLQRLRGAAEVGARLVVFPECSLSGYCLNSREEAEELAVKATGAHWESVIDVCREFTVHCVIGFLEREGENLFNTAGVFGPEGLVGKYRKVHLLVLGVDRFTATGNLGFPVFDLPGAKVGLNICYDQRFPESARLSMLGGAQVIAVPTNFPEGARGVCEILSRARAFENRVFYIVANRVGTERGTTFIGQSQIVDPFGNIVAEAGETEESTIVAEIDPSFADQKRTVNIPGEYEVDLLGDRRPEKYMGIANGEWRVGKDELDGPG
jgi:predicted amidohydrolase